jgi:di/tricarboxylate transporter
MLVLLVVMLAAFVSEKLPTEVTAMSAFALLMAFGLLSPGSAMKVFSNPGPITVAAMFVISAALEKSGAMDAMAAGLQQIPRLGLRAVLPILILSVALVSAFINNTPVVVVLLPVVMSLAKKEGVAPSKLLIPLSFASIFGGSCTLVGTSTNIIVSSVGEQAGMPPFSMFEFAAIGVPILIVGTLYLTFLGPRLLPDRVTVSGILSDEERREYIVEAFVEEGASIVGKPVGETLMKQKSRFRVLEVLRNGLAMHGPIREMVLMGGDRLLLAVSPKSVAKAQDTDGLELANHIVAGLEQINRSEGMIVEGVLGPDSALVGKSMDPAAFRQRYRLTPLAIHRRGVAVSSDIGKVRLDYGDTLLLLGTREAVEQMRGNEDILLINQAPVSGGLDRRALAISVSVVAAVILCSTTGWMPIAAAAIIGCMILILSNCLSSRDAFDAIHWPILFLIFAMLGFGVAMEETGTSLYISEHMVHWVTHLVAESWQPMALLAGVYLVTTILTEVLSNNAAAILLSALAINMANSMGLEPRPFLVAIAIAASSSFATPIGYQTNTYVYSIGGYRFIDFVKIGVPLNFLSFGIAMVVIPMFWHF